MRLMKKERFKLGPVQKKVLLLLLGGVGLSVARSSRQMIKVVKSVGNEWAKVNRQSLNAAIRQLYQSKLIKWVENENGTLTLVLSANGKKQALTYNLDKMTIDRPHRWDGKWRVVLFDIPETRKKARNALREMLKRLEFFEYQKSVFVHPYNCRREIDYLIEFFNLRPCVRFIVANELDNELHLKAYFKLV